MGYSRRTSEFLSRFEIQIFTFYFYRNTAFDHDHNVIAFMGMFRKRFVRSIFKLPHRTISFPLEPLFYFLFFHKRNITYWKQYSPAPSLAVTRALLF